MDYPTVFTALGTLIRGVHQCRDLSESGVQIQAASGAVFRAIDVLRRDAMDVFGDSAGERDRAAEALNAYRRWQDGTRAVAEDLVQVVRRYLTEDAAALLDEEGRDAATVLDVLGRRMAADGESVAQNAVAVGAPTPDAGNVGDGLALASVRSPGWAGIGIDDERARVESFRLVCAADAPTHRLIAGEERLRLIDESGRERAITVTPATFGSAAHLHNRVLDGGFRSGTASSFTHWSIASGAARFFHGSSAQSFLGCGCAGFSGTGAAAGSLYQSLSTLDPPLRPESRYALHMALRQSGVSAGTLRARLYGSGSSWVLPLASHTAAMPGSWTACGVAFVLPKAAPKDLRLQFDFDAALDGVVLLDHVALAAMTTREDRGLSVAIFQGRTDFLAGAHPDAFTLSTSSSDGGVFQSFLRDRFGVVLPSSASPTISDDWAK